jgi:23S rRNA (adenine2503-C2)-methyltransferase
MHALTALSPARLARLVPEVREDEARKIVSVAHRKGELPAGMAQVRRSALEAVRASCSLPELTVVAHEKSDRDPFQKLAFESNDVRFEAVRIPLDKPGRFSVCVSSQAGCALACAFCATGQLGLVRNLEAWEIIGQVKAVKATLATSQRVHGVVFQGMGEPMANLDRVLQAIEVLCDPSALAIDARAMTVCTSGLPAGIRRLADEAPRVRLAISIGSARRQVRRSLMPIEATHSLDEVMDACVVHVQKTGLAPMWAVTPLAGVNDTDEDARALALLAADFTRRSGKRPRISVIPFNAIAGDPFVRSTREAAFRRVMADQGVFSHMRYSGEGDIAAACGQLAARVK